jgi:hypothetical protein
VSEPDDVDFVVYDEVVDEPRSAPSAVWLALVVFVVLLVAVLSRGFHSSSNDSTYPAIRMVPGRTVGDDRSLAAAYAAKRVRRVLPANGLAARGARLESSCTSTNPHDLGGGQSWDCDVRAGDSKTGERVRFVVHVREDAGGAYAGQLERAVDPLDCGRSRLCPRVDSNHRHQV